VIIRQAFEAAFGPLPADATCHIASRCESEDCEYILATVGLSGVVALNWIDGEWLNPYGSENYDSPFGPDISNQPAEVFRGMFGPEFDKVLPEASRG
jgi:hypothetical protein